MGNTVSNEAALLTTEHQATELVGLEESTSGETHEEEPWESFLHRPFTQVLMLDEVPSTAAYVQPTLPAPAAPCRESRVESG